MTGKAGRPGGVRAVARRLQVGLVDQALSSLTNFGAGVLIARAVDPAQFGAFSLAFAAYLIALGISRAVGSEVLVARYSAAPEAGRATAIRASVGSSAVLGLAGGVAAAGAATLTHGSLRAALLALAVTFPGLLVQDAWRFAFFSQGRGARAVFNDLVWAVVLFAGLVPLASAGRLGVGIAFFVWGASATVAAIVGVVQEGFLPRLDWAPRWWREHRELAPRFLGEFVALVGALQLSLYAVGAVARLAAVGTIRAGQLLLGPLNVVFMGLGMVFVPEAAHLARRSLHELIRWMFAISVALAGAALVWGAVVLLIPSAWGHALLRGAWAPARSVVLPLAVAMAGTGATGGASFGLRGLAAARQSLRARLWVAPVTLAASVLGALIEGTRGASYGLAAAAWLGAGVYWWQFRLAVREASGGAPSRNEQADMSAPPVFT
jgi:O-antigen/teichoic acid export membrane protein